MYSVSVESNRDGKYHVTTKDYNFVMGVKGEGANPVDTVVAGLCGCVGHYVSDFLTERNVQYSSFTLRGEARQTKDDSKLSEIDLFLDLKGVMLGEQEEEALLKYVEKCKVHNTLKAGCDIRVVLI